ncbi:MAG: YafY family transcriptional regulator [Clostridiales bacterium]|nr:YafY family transcriptional regulator [Clostridiales bacterium]
MQINRLFEIVYLLLNKKNVTANKLAEHFEVSKRTILRDIDTLSAAGIPVYTSQGKGGGIFILDNFVLNQATISDEEQNQILLALQSLSATKFVSADELLSKLGALFDKSDTDWIEVDFSRWGNTKPDKERFEILKRAILKRQTITFSYPSSYGETIIRTVNPLKLVFKSKAWYLQAYCLLKNDYRTFKINRMLSVSVTSDGFHKQDFMPPGVESSDHMAPVLTHLKLQFAPYAAYRVYDEFDTKDVTENEDGTFTVTADLPDDYWLYGFLLSFGTAIKVVEPTSVRDILITQVTEIKKLYLPE